jgi:hypothetical protein
MSGGPFFFGRGPDSAASRLSDGDTFGRTMGANQRAPVGDARDSAPKKNGRAGDVGPEDEELAGTRAGRVRVTRAWCVVRSEDRGSPHVLICAFICNILF